MKDGPASLQQWLAVGSMDPVKENEAATKPSKAYPDRRTPANLGLWPIA